MAKNIFVPQKFANAACALSLHLNDSDGVIVCGSKEAKKVIVIGSATKEWMKLAKETTSKDTSVRFVLFYRPIDIYWASNNVHVGTAPEVVSFNLDLSEKNKDGYTPVCLDIREATQRQIITPMSLNPRVPTSVKRLFLGNTTKFTSATQRVISPAFS